MKVEKYYVPMFEVFLRMPSFHFDTDNVITATVENEFTFDKIGFGYCNIRYALCRLSRNMSFFVYRWYAKKIDYTTPLFNDTVQYRKEFSYFQNITNTYSSSLYDTK